jgi:hypothetical protein
MEKMELPERDSRSSGDEKAVVGGQVFDPTMVHGLPEDPDAHLSPEERAAIVGLPSLPFVIIGLTSYRIANSSGSLTLLSSLGCVFSPLAFCSGLR